MKKRNDLLPTLSRTSPVLFFLIIILNCILNPSYESFYLVIVYILECISNYTFKQISELLYNLFNTKSLPILGIGSRPPNAKSCGFILDSFIAKSYGMPSGHSQAAWFVCTYLICKIIQNFKNIKNTKNISIIDYIWLIVSCSIILAFAIYISYSRVYIEGCHTIQQVIVGGLIGIGLGYIIYYFENDAIKLLSKIW